MSKKKLDISSITNELRGQSVYFPQKKAEPDAQAKPPSTPPLVEQNKPRGKTKDIVIPRYQAATILWSLKVMTR